MPGNITGQGQTDNALEVINAAIVKYGEHEGRYKGTVDNKTLARKSGRDWNEPRARPLHAVAVAYDEEYDNPEEWEDSKISITPAQNICQVRVSKRADQTVSYSLFTLLGELKGEAIEQKRDQDGCEFFDTLPGSAGSSSTTFTVDLVHKVITHIRSGIPALGATARPGARTTGDKPKGPFYGMFHEYQRFDITSQLSGLGGAPSQITTAPAVMNFSGNTISEYMKRWIEDAAFVGDIGGVNMLVNGNLPVVGNAVKGAIYAMKGIVHVSFPGVTGGRFTGPDPRFETITSISDYANGLRVPAWAYETQTDATAPS